ncbi:hypothetical protein [Levilactobacillus fujinensis]|uniref:Lipoprotein n=1 Tax=Levilactobacillus fujinensis TaxID=2486024 RepID=A0ABW1TH43_9LACO|nr:hypothetical protein [Levilactobacillus fujinensis]
MHRGATFFLLLSSTLALTGCANISAGSHGTNYLKIYNARHQRIYSAAGHLNKTIVSSIPQDYHKLSKKKVPQTAKPSYRYVMHHAKHNVKITMQVYSNYHYAKLTGIPVIDVGMVKLTPKNYEKLNHPQKYID